MWAWMLHRTLNSYSAGVLCNPPTRVRARLANRVSVRFAHLLVFVCGRLASRMDSDGRSSAPFSRRPLRFTGTVLTPEWGSSTPCDHPLETRDRLVVVGEIGWHRPKHS